MEKVERASFVKMHGDTIAIIASTIGVNIAIAAIMISMWMGNTHRIDACNARMDATLTRMDNIYNILMNRQEQAPKCNSWRPYEDYIPKHDSRSTPDTKQGE